MPLFFRALMLMKMPIRYCRFHAMPRCQDAGRFRCRRARFARRCCPSSLITLLFAAGDYAIILFYDMPKITIGSLSPATTSFLISRHAFLIFDADAAFRRHVATL